MRAFIIVCLLCISRQAVAQSAQAPSPDGQAVYLRLVNASKQVESYQASAVVSERVFGARAQGSDKAYAEFMGFVARTDLSAAKPCLATLISQQGLSEADASEVSSVYETAIGKKLIERSQKMLKASIEAGRATQPPTDDWSDEEKRAVAAILKNDAVQRFHALATQQSFMQGTLACYKSVLSAKHPGVNF